ncbi:MAG: hypothetical protein M1826_000862 [Phylliscum demangeonii]|nr:MAG: hypothetical protein M1826_000862 [Phylliscum demangeonii]
MRVSQLLQQMVQHRTPLIHFLGKRTTAKSIDHTAHAHPAAPSGELPDSFVAYRSKAQQHGPLTHRQSISSAGGVIGGHPGRSLGPVEAAKGQYFDRSELPPRFGRLPWSQMEMDAVETGGASLLAEA